MLSSETMCMSMIYAHADGKEQKSNFCHGINDYRLTVEKEGHRRPMTTSMVPTPPKICNSLDREPWKRTLENCDKGAEV